MNVYAEAYAYASTYAHYPGDGPMKEQKGGKLSVGYSAIYAWAVR